MSSSPGILSVQIPEENERTIIRVPAAYIGSQIVAIAVLHEGNVSQVHAWHGEHVRAQPHTRHDTTKHATHLHHRIHHTTTAHVT